MGFREFFFCVLSVKPDSGKVGGEIPATDQGTKGEEPPLGGVEQNTTRYESESGGQHPRTRYDDKPTGENARMVCPPLANVV